MTTPARVTGLDVLRFIAVLLVLFRHYTPGVPVMTRGGWIGVDLFFVLSGWLVSGLLFKEYRDTRAVAPVRFLARRGFKIYPSFWILIPLSIPIVLRLHANMAVGSRNVIAEFLFFQNYTPGVWGHTWSLAVEEHFYFGLAALIWILARTGRLHVFPALFVFVAVLCLGLRILNVSAHPEFDWYRDMARTHLRIDSLMFGAVLSYYHYFGGPAHWTRKLNQGWIALVGVVLLAPPFIWRVEDSPWLRTVGLTAIYGGAGLLVLSLGTLRSRNPVVSFVASLGAASYSMYLWHLVVRDAAVLLQRHLVPGSFTIIYFAGCVAVGWLFTRMIEAPFLRLRERLVPSPSKTPSAVETTPRVVAVTQG